jgi:N-acetylglucosamine-6-phosphate deacetylase
MTRIRIEGGRGSDGEPIRVGILDGIQATVGDLDGHVIDASGLTVVPGFIDIQINGAFGSDFTEDPSSIWQVGALLPATGVTAFFPTIITAPHDRVEAAIAAMAMRPNGYIGAEPVGLHIEGPHLAPTRRGAHPEGLLTEPLDTKLEPHPSIAIITVAPELRGALEMIRRFATTGTIVSIGHSAATTAQARDALDAGATLGTHLLNAMPPITAREPGIAGLLLTDPRAFFSMIVDGHHHDPATIELAWSAGADRFVLITDAIAAAGMPDGEYQIGGVHVTLAGGAVRKEDGTLAGAATTMDRAMEILAGTVSSSLADVLRTATTNPARAVRRPDLGRLRDGTRADICILDGSTVVCTIAGGRIAHLADPDRCDPALLTV